MNINKNPTTPSNLRRISETPSNRLKSSTRISESNYLPPEICTQIFAKLPVKTVLRIRCVCKSWCSIIDQPDFMDMYLKLCNKNSKLLVVLECLGRGYKERCMLTVHEADLLQQTCQTIMKSDRYLYNIVGSCNGLLLVNRMDRISCYPDELRLWNPSIRKSLILPANPFPRYLSASTRYLFGFAPESKDYKVVAFTFAESPGLNHRKMNFAVYTLRDQQWTVRNNQLDISLPTFHSFTAAVLFQGAAYWLGQNDNQSQRNELTHLCSFDFESENITFLELPFSLNESSQHLGFPFLLGESLAIFSISMVASSIWVLEQDNIKRPWTLWFSGKSSRDGYDLFEFCYWKCQKVFYYENESDTEHANGDTEIIISRTRIIIKSGWWLFCL